MIIMDATQEKELAHQSLYNKWGIQCVQICYEMLCKSTAEHVLFFNKTDI